MKTTSRTGIALLMMTLVGGTTLAAHAQQVRIAPTATIEMDTAWSRYLGLQLSRSLQSPSEETRAQAIEQITFFARQHPGRFQLGATVPALVTVYRTDAQPSFRLAALAALHALGDVDGMQAVRRYVIDQTDPRVQQASLGALLDYFGAETFAGTRDTARMARDLMAHWAAQPDLFSPRLAASQQ